MYVYVRVCSCVGVCDCVHINLLYSTRFKSNYSLYHFVVTVLFGTLIPIQNNCCSTTGTACKHTSWTAAVIQVYHIIIYKIFRFV